MKVIHLNLASRPYRDYRPVWAVVAVTGVLCAVLLVYNVQTAYRYLSNTEDTRARIGELQAQTAREQRLARTVAAKTEKFDLRELSEQSHFINGEIEERAFSWSALLDDLESVLPGDVHLTSLNPTIDPKGGVHLNLTCVAKSSDGMAELLRGLFASPRFENPFPQAEQTRPDGFNFTMVVDYLPTTGGPAR
ncbi:MAG: PilN domain-containing protein [Thermoanaerobaculia bacterium]